MTLAMADDPKFSINSLVWVMLDGIRPMQSSVLSIVLVGKKWMYQLAFGVERNHLYEEGLLFTSPAELLKTLK